MLTTLLFLLLCAILAIASVPLILKLVPPNPFYGIRTSRTADNPDLWFRVNQIGGCALLAAALLTALLIMLYSGTWLKSFWSQLITLVILVGAAIGATLFFERKL